MDNRFPFTDCYCELRVVCWKHYLNSGFEISPFFSCFKGVPLEIPLWNTLLSVYIDNRCVDFEPIDFLSKLWETSAAEPNLVSFIYYSSCQQKDFQNVFTILARPIWLIVLQAEMTSFMRWLILNPYYAYYIFLLVKMVILPTLLRLVIAGNHWLFNKNTLVVLESWCLELSKGTKVFGWKWFFLTLNRRLKFKI